MSVSIPLSAAARATVAGMMAFGLAFAPATSVLAAETWVADVGAETSDQAIQANAFFPKDISIHVGDSITWNSKAGEIHTVTFGYGPPPPGLTGFEIVATPFGGDTFDGTGWHNSGILVNEKPAPAGEFNSYPLRFTHTGIFTFVCLVHEDMQGTLHVLDAGAALPLTQSAYTQQNIPQANQLLAQGRQVGAAGLAAAHSSRTPTVTAGDGQLLPTASASLAVLRFLPDTLTIHAGESVTWDNRDPETPHTVTFGPEPSGGPFATLLPIGTDGPQHATISGPVTSTVNSGFLAAPGQFGMNGTQFTVTFTAPGTYAYICALHDDLGMIGTIKVLPKP